MRLRKTQSIQTNNENINNESINIEAKEIELQKELEEISISNEMVLNECLDHFIIERPKELSLVERGIKTREALLNEVELYLKGKRIKNEQLNTLKKMFKEYIWGYHILNDLINDKDISDIKIINKDTIRVKRLGKRYTSNVKFKTNEELNKFVRIVAIKNKINLSEINAIQTFTDKETNENFILRINISTEYVNSVDHSYLHIRKISKNKYTPEDLIKLGMATKEQMEYLIKCIKEGKKIIFTGKGGSGKTTLLNTLIDEIPHDKCGLVIQENEELFSTTHPDLMFQKVKIAKGEGRIEYTLKDLSINGLLIDLDYFVIGEIKGGEALYFLNASYTGHVCLGAVHGNSSTEAIDKLVDYMKYESDYSREDLIKMIGNIDVVVFLKDFKCHEISEIVGYDYEKKNLIYNTIYENQIRVRDSQKV